MTHNISTYQLNQYLSSTAPINRYFSWRCSCGAEQAGDEKLFNTEPEAHIDGVMQHAREAEVADLNAKIVKLQARIVELETAIESDLLKSEEPEADAEVMAEVSHG